MGYHFFHPKISFLFPLPLIYYIHFSKSKSGKLWLGGLKIRENCLATRYA